MMSIKNIKPLYLYLIAVGCFLASNLFSKAGLAVVNYTFAAAGFVFIFLAIKKYFTKKAS